MQEVMLMLHPNNWGFLENIIKLNITTLSAIQIEILELLMGQLVVDYRQECGQFLLYPTRKEYTQKKIHNTNA